MSTGGGARSDGTAAFDHVGQTSSHDATTTTYFGFSNADSTECTWNTGTIEHHFILGGGVQDIGGTVSDYLIDAPSSFVTLIDVHLV